MAITSYPFDGQTTSEDQYSSLLGAAIPNSVGGNPGGTDLKPAVGSGMNVTLAPGKGYVRGFCMQSDSTYTATLSTVGSQARIDLLVIRVDTTANSASPFVIAGTPGSTTPPAYTSNDLPIAQITIPASTLSLSSGMVKDLRSWTRGITTVADSSRYPSTPYAGQYVDDLSLGQLMRYNGTLWAPVAPPLPTWTAIPIWDAPRTGPDTDMGTPMWCRDTQGFIHLEGSFGRPSGFTNNILLGILPPEARPPQRVRKIAPCWNGAGYIEVNASDGGIRALNFFGGSVYIAASIAGISYRGVPL